VKITKHVFGYEHEVLFDAHRKLFGFDDRIVFEAERDRRFFVIEDLGMVTDQWTYPWFNVNDWVHIVEFETAEQRETYLLERYVQHRPWLTDRMEAARAERGSRE
jgi:hypothetical protein